jgi:hypothetical protein
MILLDFSQVVISNYMMQVKSQPKLDEGLFRHVTLNSIRMYNAQFRESHGRMVICTDSHNSWRRDVFPFYKAGRRRDREDSNIDWQHLFEVLRMVRREITEVFPYKVMEVDGAEADDIISTLARRFSPLENVVIISSDKDFQQLQRWPNVQQFSPYTKEFVVCPNPQLFLKEHIMRGDRSDGVPNFLSPDDIFMTEGRQSPVTEKKLAVWLEQEPETFCDSRMLRNYRRNEQLVDLTRTPDHIQQTILEEFVKPPIGAANKIYSYLATNRLSNLVEHLADFMPGNVQAPPPPPEQPTKSTARLVFE